MELNFDSPVRLTEELLPLLRALHAELDRERRVDRGQGRARDGGLLRRLEGGADRLDRRAAPRGARERRARRARAARLRGDRGLPAGSARKNPLTRWMVGEARAGGRRDRRRRPGGRGERIVPRGYALFPALRIAHAGARAPRSASAARARCRTPGSPRARACRMPKRRSNAAQPASAARVEADRRRQRGRDRVRARRRIRSGFGLRRGGHLRHRVGAVGERVAGAVGERRERVAQELRVARGPCRGGRPARAPGSAARRTSRP